MPTVVETLFISIKSGKFDEIKAFIQAHPEVDLINAKHPGTERSLAIYLIQITTNTKEAKPRELLYFLLSHPKMDWKFITGTKQTAVSALLDAVITDGDFSLIESLKNVGGFIFNAKLTYEIAVARLEEFEKILALRIEMGKPKSDIDSTKARMDKCKKAVALIRDITILHALKTDNADLMERLDNAGGKPLGILGDFGGEILPSFFIGKAQPNPRIKAWNDAKFKEDLARREIEREALTERFAQHAFFLEQKKKIEAEHAVKTIAILERATNERMDRIDAAIKRSGVQEDADPIGCQCIIS